MLDERYGNHSVRYLDDNNYVLVRHGVNSKSGEGTEVIVGHYGQLLHCVKELARLEANHCGSIAEWLVRYREVMDELGRAF